MEAKKYPHFEKQLKVYIGEEKITKKDMLEMSLVEICEINKKLTDEIHELSENKKSLILEYQQTGIKTDEYFKLINRIDALVKALLWIAPIILDKAKSLS